MIEEILVKLANSIFSEYGAFVAFLCLALWRERKRADAADSRVAGLTDEMLKVIPDNTAAINILTTKFDQREEVRNAKSN